MPKRRPWTLLEKLASNKADALAREVAALKREVQKIQAQRVGLAQALEHYALAPEQAVPISLIRNQRTFRDKLVHALDSLDRQLEKSSKDVAQAISQWQAAQAKADAYDKLRQAERSGRLLAMDKAEGKAIEESAQQALFARDARPSGSDQD